MTKGVVIFAFDVGDISYTNIAQWSAKRIQHYLGLPVCLITDQQPANADMFDHVVIAESAGNGYRDGTAWKNLGRHRAYQLSPYDHTVMLDADYVVASDQLNVLFDIDQDILSMRWAYDITGRRDYDDLNYMGRNRMPSSWATVMYWRRSTAAEMVFGMMEMIESNWQHYRNIYGITERRFRNDYALAIASNTVMGHQGQWPEIPWSMANVESDCVLSCLDDDVFEVCYRDSKQKLRKSLIAQQDFHAMDKRALEAIIGS